MSKMIAKIEELIIAVVLAVMSIITFLNVITRNFIQYSLSYTEEITINLFVLLTFVGAAIGVRRGAHLGFTLILEKSPAKIKKFLILFIGILSVFVFIIVTYFAIDMIMFQYQLGSTTPALRFPKWIFSLAIPLGTILCIYRTIEAMVIQFKALSEKKGAQ